MVCTWKGCDEHATRPQIRSDGSEWANLCKKHNDMIEEALNDMIKKGGPKEIRLMLSYYVKAQGGADSFFSH